MSTRALQQVRALRDEAVHAHQLALESGNLDRMVSRLNRTARATANVYINKFGGTYNPQQTLNYLQKMAMSQLSDARTDGRGSASSASHFGTREFARQNPGRDWILTWRHFPSARPRPSHVDADGSTIPVTGSFGVVPSMGAPHCNCVAELGVPTVRAPESPASPRGGGGLAPVAREVLG